jgi:hypothetical protein
VGPAAGLAACATPPEDPAALDSLAGDLAAYAQFGPKWAGGDGDNASGRWIERRLAEAGLETERQGVRTNDVASIAASLQLGAQSARLAVHDEGRAFSERPVEAPLVVWTQYARDIEQARGAVIMAHLASRRWSSATQAEIRNIIASAAAAGAVALVLVTHGATNELIRLNRALAGGELPVLLLAPREWSDIVRNGAPTRATLIIERAPAAREAFNVIGRFERGDRPFVVVSTPRSGWGVCAGERGPGVAVFLNLVQWARRALPRHNLAFVATSAHEFEGAGADAFLEHGAPAGEQTTLWLHLGAGFAARDWHETAAGLVPLPSVDPQRFLLSSERLLPSARLCFAGAAGLESPYPVNPEAAGELGQIVSAGHSSVLGLLGAHRFHHTASDDMRCVEPQHTVEVTQRLQRLLQIECAE